MLKSHNRALQGEPTKMNRKQRRQNSKQQKQKNFTDFQKRDLITQAINTGAELIKFNKLGEAETLYKNLLQHDPGHPEIYYSLGVIAHKRKDFPAALNFMNRAITIDPKHHKAIVAAGFIKLDLGKPEEAIEYCEKSLKIDRNADNTALYGTVLKLLGRFDESEKMYLEAISYNPDHILAYKDIISAKKVTEDDQSFLGAKALYDRIDEFEDEDQIRLNFALGKAYYDLKDYDQSFKHYKDGNDGKARQYRLSQDSLQGYAQKLPRIFTPNAFKRFENMGYEDDTPIFIVGMPRSGTTLTEQIIASHPEVHGAGELTSFLNCALHPDEPEKHGLSGGNDTRVNAKYVNDLDDDTLTTLGKNYVDYARSISPHGINKIVDKMPFNFLRVGLIKLALPNAKIIYARRNPMDIGLSVYRQLFAEDMPWAYDLEQIGKMLKSCDELMQHWQDVLGDHIYVSNYEDLVQTPEEETRKLIDYCGLKWDDACLSPHKNTRSVKTASFAQVRAPINTKSVEGWRRFEKGLKPLADFLDMS